MNADDKLTIPREFWLERELSKVVNPKRRQWLREKIFAGDEGWQKFSKIMKQRKGAHEFETGEWQKEFPRPNKTELHLENRPCMGGCGTPLPVRIAPWGELCGDILPICPKCKTKIETNNIIMSDTNKTNDPLKSIQEALNVLATGKQTLKAELKQTLEKARAELNVLMSPQLGFTFDDIFSDTDFSAIVKTFKIQAGKPTAAGKPEPREKSGRRKKKSKMKTGGLKEIILEVMADGISRSRPEIAKILKEKHGVKSTNLYGMSGVAGLVKDGKLKQEGKKHKAKYTIIK